jgi:hypothetical protein
MVINPFRNRVQFIVERLLLSGTFARLAVGAAFMAVVALAMGALGYLVARGTDQSFRHPAEAVWWAFLRLTDSGYLGDDEGTGLRVVSTLVTVAGTVLFLGVLVAVLTQGLNEWIRKLEMGLTPISARHHVIVLGWSSRLPGLVRNMLESEQRLRRFLARIGAKRLKLVLLWDAVSPALTADLMAQIGAPRKTSRIILRSGSPLRLDHLTRVDYLRASAIVLPAENHRSNDGTSRSDNSALKTILSISQSLRLTDPRAEAPLLVAELFDARKIPIALGNYRGPIEVVAGDEVISRMLAQMVRHPQISQVYRELLTHGLGNELFARSCGADLAGRSFWQVAAALPEALLVGVTQPDGNGVHSTLNPSPDYRFQATDKLIYVAREWEAGTPPPVSAAATPAWPAPQKRLEAVRRDDLRLLVLGWSRRIPAFVQELESYANQGFDVTVASRYPLADRERELRGYGGQTKRVRLRHVETDCTVPEQLAALEPAAYDVVLCLASDLADTDEESDARTLVEYAILQQLWSGLARPAADDADDDPAPRKRPRLVIELLDELNVALIDPERCEYLLSPQVLSHMLGQVALRRELNAVFEQLFNSGETEITFRDVVRYGVAPGERIDFARLQALARLHHEVALGYFSEQANGTGDLGLMLNPGPAAAWTVSAGDRVVVLRN